MMWVLVGMGSNIEPQRHLKAAVAMLGHRFELAGVSSVYQSPPADGSDQSDYLNAAALVRTALLPGTVKQVLGEIETELGRVRTSDRFAARSIDLDMVMYDGWTFSLAGKHVPDPDLLRYGHVAVPAADLLPTVRHPETGEVLAAIANRLNSGRLVRRDDIALV